MNHHENLGGGARPRPPSGRRIASLWAALLVVYGLLPLPGGGTVRAWALAAASALALLAVLRPSWLARIVQTLAAAMNMVVMAAGFLLVVTPAAIVLWAFGKDALRRRAESGTKTFWVPRVPPGVDPGSLRRQF